MNIGEKVSENFEAIILLIGLMIIQMANTYFPEYYQITGWLACGVIFGLIIFMNLYAQIQATQKPYLECITYPSRQKLRIYVENYEYHKRVGSISNPALFFATKILLKYPITYRPIGKVKALVINHEHSWDRRLDWKPAKAEFRGIQVDHPHTETLILYESSMTDVDKTEPIPIFFLAHAGKDYWREKTQKETTKEDGTCEKCQYIEQNVELERETKELRQKLIELESFIEKVKDALRGIQRAGTKGVVDLVWILFNDIHSLHVTIANAIKSRGLIVSLPLKLIIIALCILAPIGLLVARPDILTGLGEFASNPINMMFLTGAMVLGILVAYYLIKRRSV